MSQIIQIRFVVQTRLPFRDGTRTKKGGRLSGIDRGGIVWGVRAYLCVSFSTYVTRVRLGAAHVVGSLTQSVPPSRRRPRCKDERCSCRRWGHRGRGDRCSCSCRWRRRSQPAPRHGRQPVSCFCQRPLMLRVAPVIAQRRERDVLIHPLPLRSRNFRRATSRSVVEHHVTRAIAFNN